LPDDPAKPMILHGFARAPKIIEAMTGSIFASVSGLISVPLEARRAISS
jgi:hypothetical protein